MARGKRRPKPMSPKAGAVFTKGNAYGYCFGIFSKYSILLSRY